jgi:hypothetical protein
MRLAFQFLAVAFFASLAACANTDSSPEQGASALVGTWQVDLRPSPKAAPYFQEFVVTAVTGSSFEGTFYGAPVTQARVNSNWGAVRIAFVTQDGSGPYHHSAVLSGTRLEGLTNSTGRDFLAYWSAVKR